MTSARDRLLEEVESIKNVLVARATGEVSDDSEYFRLRISLMREPGVVDMLPRFVRTCRNLGEFWPYIKEQSPTYAGRRQFLAEQFDPLLTFLEQHANAPSDDSMSVALDKVDAPHIAIAWQKALERRATDPSGAITAARTLIETVCKHILDSKGVVYADAEELPKLYRLASESLRLSPSQHTEEVFRRILGSCQAIVEGLAAIRNRHSDAHGSSKEAVGPASRHAELAVNLAGTMVTFLLATLDERKS